MKLFYAAITIATLTGCTSISVTPIQNAADIQNMCIQKNEKVLISDFISVLQDGFKRHGINTEVYTASRPPHCQYTVTYTARRSWDFAPYLSTAEIWVYQDTKQVAYAQYYLKGKGGLSLNKWASTKSKLTPLIDQLLAEYPIKDR